MKIIVSGCPEISILTVNYLQKSKIQKENVSFFCYLTVKKLRFSHCNRQLRDSCFNNCYKLQKANTTTARGTESRQIRVNTFAGKPAPPKYTALSRMPPGLKSFIWQQAAACFHFRSSIIDWFFWERMWQTNLCGPSGGAVLRLKPSFGDSFWTSQASVLLTYITSLACWNELKWFIYIFSWICI